MNIIDRAKEIATYYHRNQFRKYTGEPYIIHPENVVNILKTIDATSEMLSAAWLHDVVEDTECTNDIIEKEFGRTISIMVEMLTDVSKKEDGNRLTRKTIDREHTARACPCVKSIKLADLIDNTNSIVNYDKNFARVYLQEKEALLEVLKEGNKILWDLAFKRLQWGQTELIQHNLAERINKRNEVVDI